LADKNFAVRHGLVVNGSILVTNGMNVGIGTSIPTVSFHINSTDAIVIPTGNTGQRPTGSNGQFRFNSETATFEGYANGAWGPIAGIGYYKGNGGTVGLASAANNIFRINANTLTANVTFIAGENASATGPISVATGITLTVDAGARVSII
jgi:hypothetical protein